MVFSGALIRPNKYAGILCLFLALQSYAQIRPTSGDERLKALQKRQEARNNSPLKTSPSGMLDQPSWVDG